MSVDSKKKGNRNERGIVHLLKTWTNYEFARTPQSGGLNWKKSYTSGDVICIDDIHGPRFPFSIEAKFHNDIQFHYLMDGSIGKKTAKIIHFWDQCVKDSITAKKVPLLFFRKNMMRANMHFIIVPTDFFRIWVEKLKGDLLFPYGIFHYERGDYRFTILNSIDLFKTPYLDFYKSGKKLLRHEKES